MPIYNVAPYLEIALNSVANQTHKNLEILMVDDVSDDGSEVIMAAYAEKDPRFRHIRLTMNGGSGAARNLAIAQARGSYLGFLDGDDVFTPHAIARLLTSLEATGADLAVGHVMRNRGGELVSSRLHREYFATKRLRTSIVELPELVYDTTVWNKLFRTSFWRDNTLAFPEGVLYQDMVVMADAYALNPTVDVIGELTNIWRVREDKTSVTQSRADLSNLNDRLAAIDHARKQFRPLGDAVWSRYQRKILSLDFPLFIRRAVLDNTTYLTRLSNALASAASEVPATTLALISTRSRLVCFLAMHQRFDLVAQADELTTSSRWPTLLSDESNVLLDTSSLTLADPIPDAYVRLLRDLKVEVVHARATTSLVGARIDVLGGMNHRPPGSAQEATFTLRAENGDRIRFNSSSNGSLDDLKTQATSWADVFGGSLSRRKLSGFVRSHPAQQFELRLTVRIGQETRRITMHPDYLSSILSRINR